MISIAGISAVAFLAAVRAAAPSGLPVRIAWDAPAGCSDAETFFAAVASRADRIRRAEPGEEGTRIEVKLSRLGPKIHGELRLATDDGRSELRKVEGATCDEVAEALSLTAALALSASARRAPASPTGGQGAIAAPPAATPAPSIVAPPLVAAEAPATVSPIASPPAPAPTSPSGAPPPRTEPVSVPAAAVPRPAPAAAGRSLGAWLAVGLGPVAGEVVAPHLSLGGIAHLRVAEPGLDRLAPSAALGLLYLRNDLLNGAGEAVFRLAAATVTACPGWGWRSDVVTVELCAVGMGGWLLASDAEVTVSHPVTRSWWSAGAALRARAPVGAGFLLQLDASATVPLVKRRFVTTTPEQTVGTSPGVAPIFSLVMAHGL